MTDDDTLIIPGGLTLPRSELLLRATRSSGPGGQHVNTSSSRIELVWDIATSPSLNLQQRALLLERLASRVDSHGRLRLVAQEERSQLRNREAVIARLGDILARALVVPKQRKRTRPPPASRRARLETKRRRSTIKRDRQQPVDE
jgi:ribosome-associated protein